MNTATAQPLHRSVTAAADRRARTPCGWLSVLACALLLVAGVGFAQGKPDATPPFLSESVAPNLIITIDDSDSMKAGYFGPDAGIKVGKWIASPHSNPVYFNPDEVSFNPDEAYPAPPQADGQPYPDDDQATDVFAYPFRGIESCARHRIDLTTAFEPIVSDDIGAAGQCAEPDRDEAWKHTPSTLKRNIGGQYNGQPYYYRFQPDNEYWVGVSVSVSPDPFFPEEEVVPYDESRDAEEDKVYVPCDDPPDDGSPTPECLRCQDQHDPPDYRTPDPCFGDRELVPEEAMRAFIRWYKFYRTRMHAVKTATMRVLPSLPDDVRISYQGLIYDIGQSDVELAPGSLDGPNAFDDLVERFAPTHEHRASDHLDQSQNVETIYRWIKTVPPHKQGTALVAAHIRVGEFVSRGVSLADDITQYSGTGGSDPSADNMCGAKCRHNFHLIVADGDWEDWWGGERVPPSGVPCPSGESWILCNQDRVGVSLPATADSPFGDISNTLGPPYTDDNVGMLADAAFYYWARDLRTDILNEVPPLISHVEDGTDQYDEVNFWDPRNNPAHWQHLSLFAVGFGLVHGIPIDADGNVEPPSSGFPSCVEPPYDYDGEATVCDLVSSSDDSKSIPSEAKADDLYHATLNARGRYFSASRPEALVESLKSVLNAVAAVAKQQTANAPVAITAGSLSDDTRIYQAVTNSEDWTGEVRGVRVSTGYNCSPKLRGEFCEELDDPYQTTRAEGSFPAPSLRKIYTMADGSPAVFDWDDLSIAQQSALMTCGDDQNPSVVAMTPQERAEACIDWLRGEEVDGFRERETLLGDILGSGPVVEGPPRRLFADQDYQKFKKDNAGRPTIIYVGANDGMLHAFNADSEAPKLEEVFAYVPEAVYANLADLSNPAYGGADPGKKAYVDGPINVADAKFSRDGGNKWGTVLVGALGAGAQGLYALDITDPTLVDADAAPESLILWEFTDASGSDDDDGKLDGRDMGYNIWKPAIVRITDPDDADEPTWVVLVGNGFASTSTDQEDSSACTDDDDLTNCTISQTGNAVLYVLNIGGADENRILARLDTGKGDAAAPNGLAEVSTLDTNGDLIADRAYAGDLYGNVWRFDLTDLTEPPTLMFTAKDPNGNPQPITSRVVFTRHPYGGYMLLFGTGRFVYESDKGNDSVQTFYGIWDRQGLDFGAGAIASETPPTRLDLMQHELLEVVNVSGDGGGIVSRGRTSTKEPVSEPDPPRGWMIDLVLRDGIAEGERVVVAPQVRRGHVTFVSMLSGDLCEAGGSSWINTLNAIDGSRPDYIPFDYDRDGGIDQYDLLEVDGELLEGTSIGLGPGILSEGRPIRDDIGVDIDLHNITLDPKHPPKLPQHTGLSSARTWLQLD
jgi:type IV pilus assembly protein PilY1